MGAPCTSPTPQLRRRHRRHLFEDTGHRSRGPQPLADPRHRPPGRCAALGSRSMSSENAGTTGAEPDAVEVTDLTWQGDLLARIYTPPAAARGEGSRAAVVDVHGGAWASQDRTLGVR